MRGWIGLIAAVAVAAPASANDGIERLAELEDAPLFTLDELLQHTSFRPSRLAREIASQELGPVVLGPTLLTSGADLHTVGEIIVVEGDAATVTDFGGGQYGLRFDNQVQNLPEVVRRVLTRYGDDFDFVAIWTSFWDFGADGLAYYVGVRNDTQGIGRQRFDQGSFWGSGQGGRLQGVLNMKSIGVYGNITNPNNFVYPVMGQEMTHRWLAFMRFRRANGQVSGAMLGRDGAHWSSLMHAEASVQDGNDWRDNGDGTFTLLRSNRQFSTLDLYGVGMFGPDEVEPWFLIEDASYQGQQLTGLTQLPRNITIEGTRTDIGIDQVVSANGPRVPAALDAQKDFRIAYVLVTAPGETVADVQGEIASIETFRELWDQRFVEWTHGRGFLCSRVTADCDRAKLVVTGHELYEIEGDGDGMPSPGETVQVLLTVTNEGGGVAEGPRAHIIGPEGVDVTVGHTPVTFDDLAPGESVTLDAGLVLTIGPDAPCARELRFKVELATGDVLTQGELVIPIGFRDLFYDDFEEDRGWLVDPYGTDDATAGHWERARPQGVNARRAGLDFQTQPDGGVDGGQCYVTGARAGQQIGSHDVDDGITTLLSPVIPVAGADDPRVSYYSWRTGLDFNSVAGMVVADDNDPLSVELSADGGATWILVEEDISNAQAWQHKEWRLADFFEPLPDAIQLRVIARDMDPQSLSEAAIDKVRVFDLQPSCFGIPEPPVDDPSPGDDPANPDDPGLDPSTPGGVDPLTDGRTSGCAATGGAPAAALLLLLAMALVVRRRPAPHG